MEDLQTSEGVQKLREELEHFLDENKPLEEKEMARMTELAHHLESEKLKMQAGQISGRCSEVDEMIKKKFKTVKAAEDRLQVCMLYFRPAKILQTSVLFHLAHHFSVAFSVNSKPILYFLVAATRATLGYLA